MHFSNENRFIFTFGQKVSPGTTFWDIHFSDLANAKSEGQRQDLRHCQSGTNDSLLPESLTRDHCDCDYDRDRDHMNTVTVTVTVTT
jgi:hypothetical protein